MGLLELLAIILLVAWFGGLALDVGGALVHTFLVLALVVFAMRYFRHAV